VLRAALAAGVPYVGLVASMRRADGVRAELAALGVPEQQIARVSSPAGLDIGSRGAPEIALSVFAEMVAVRAGDRPVPAPPPVPAPEPDAEAAVDPVCGMAVAPVPASPSVQHGGRTYWFCGSGCRQAFADDPARFSG
jgi:xanthine dehydrogenase accessory factor